MESLGTHFNILFLLIWLFGVPHGVFDLLFIQEQADHSWMKMLFGVFVYVLMVWGVISLWLFFPLTSLIIFLVISTLHFGRTNQLFSFEKVNDIVSWMTHGGVVTFFLPWFGFNQLIPIFNALGVIDVTLLLYFLNGMMVIWISACLRYVFTKKTFDLFDLETIVWILLTVCLPPLLVFMFYFCCSHANKHYYWIFKTRGNLIQKNKVTLSAILLMTWLLGLFIYWDFYQINWASAAIKTCFIGLAALTVPHMLMIDLLSSFKQRII